MALFGLRRMLIFQEPLLFRLEPLGDLAMATKVGKRYPAVLVDDLHLSRFIQLTLVAQLREEAAHFTTVPGKASRSCGLPLI